MKYIFVDTDNGGTPSNATPDTATSKYHTSSSWPASGARWSTLSGALNDTTIRALTDDVTIYCRGVAADTTAASSGSMTCAGLTIIGDVAGAVWDTTKYRIVYTGAISVVVSLSGASITGNITVRNLQVEANGTATGPSGIRITSSVNSSTHTVDSCIVRMGNTTSATGNPIDGISVVGTATGQTINVENTIVYNITGTGGSAAAYGMRFGTTNAATVRVYNCVVHDIATGGTIARGIHANTGDTVTVKNCAVFDTLDDFSNCDTVAYCASDDGDGTNAVTGLTWTNQFVDYANGNFALKSGSSLIGAGIGPSSDANVPATDIAGVTRSGTTTDIGAAMFVSGGLTITSVNTTNTAFSAQTNSAVIGTGLSASVVCTYAGIACTNESASSSTSLKITFPNFFTNNIKLGRNYEFKVVG